METDVERRARLLFPRAVSAMDRVRANNVRFVHYTTAETALSIISKRALWLRNAATMNDYSEVQHGLDCLSFALNGPAGVSFRMALDAIKVGLADRVLGLIFNDWLNNAKFDTYLTSFSEHRDAEDDVGRLSMWRAYGGDSGVAVVFQNRPFLSDRLVLRAFSSPVAYLDKHGFAREMAAVAEGIRAESKVFESWGEVELLNGFFAMLHFAVLCTKHPGFEEECEWRAIYTPKLLLSEVIEKDVQCIRGIPQLIYKIPLRNIPDKGLVDFEISDLIERLIIGPTRYPYPSFLGLSEALNAAGVPDAEARVTLSNIPLRR